MTTATGPDWATHARRLADLLWERGDIRSPQWHAAIAEVPRDMFVPRAYEQDNTGQWQAWNTAGNSEHVYAPKTLVTTLADRGGHLEPVSSSTNPELMVRMLEILDFQDGHRVLEIGTGTGYNAALLCHRLGDDLVFSVDVDAELITLARQRLAAAGYRPTLAAVDGAGGLPEHAPYDRIIATCAVPMIPGAWAEQLAPGGSILVDLKLAISAGNLVHLHHRGDGMLQGQFIARRASFMTMRHHNDQPVATRRAQRAEAERCRPTDAPARPWDETPVVWFLAQLSGLPRDVVYGLELHPDTYQPTAATLEAPDGSWARISLDDRVVTEAGETPLWTSIERAHRLWVDLGGPSWHQLGLTVTPDGHHTVWLDEPRGDHTWVLRTVR